jgi:hypothetical protein
MGYSGAQAGSAILAGHHARHTWMIMERQDLPAFERDERDLE